LEKTNHCIRFDTNFPNALEKKVRKSRRYSCNLTFATFIPPADVRRVLGSGALLRYAAQLHQFP
jgi:hypothetical protein